MNWLELLGVPPQLRPLVLASRWALPGQDDHGAPQPGADDRAWALEHPRGYGSVDAPSPWGYDRGAFWADHPGYQGGYYNPSSGAYDSPRETPFTAPSADGPVLIGTGQPPQQASPVGLGHPPVSPESDPSMGTLPSGGDSSVQVFSPESSPAMANLPTGGNSEDQQGGVDLGAFLSALADAADQNGGRS